MAQPVYILNGPNLNLLGTREPDIYGHETLADIERRCHERAAALDLAVEFRQTNSEGCLIDWIQEANRSASALILNAGAYTHTSIAIFDALRNCALPVVEVHLSNIHAREEFRHKSFVSPLARGVIVGFGSHGYDLALEAVARLLAPRKA